MDLSQPLRYKALVERQGYAFFVDLDYENIPDFCTHCKMIGHHVNIFKRIHPIDHEERENNPIKNRRQDRVPEKQYVQVHDGRKNQGKNPTVIDVDIAESSTKNKKSRNEIREIQSAVGNNEDVRNNEEENNTPASQGVRNEINNLQLIPYNAAYHATTVNNMLDGLVEDVSSDDSDFVENTHQHVVDENVLVHAEIQNEDNNADEVLPARIEHDMKFLNDSWANMVEQEDNRLQVLPDEGFQQVTRKKKNQKKITSPKKKYATRSKGEASNPPS